MPRRVIILDSPDPRSVRVAYWVPARKGAEGFLAKAGSASVFTGATAEENAAIASGAVVERVETHSVPDGADPLKIAEILEDRWRALEQEVAADARYDRYGTSWDGDTWAEAK